MNNWTQEQVDAHLAKFGLLASVLADEAKPNKAEVQAEKELLRLCCHRLSLDGIEYLHLSPRARERIGWPDLVFVIRGVPFAVELKTAHGTLREEQRQCLVRMQANGWRTIVCRSYEEFCEAITINTRKEQT